MRLIEKTKTHSFEIKNGVTFDALNLKDSFVNLLIKTCIFKVFMSKQLTSQFLMQVYKVVNGFRQFVGMIIAYFVDLNNIRKFTYLEHCYKIYD